MDEREVQNFREEVEKTTEELQSFGRSLKVLSPALLKLADPTGKLADSMNAATRATKDKSKADKDSTDATVQQTKATQKNIHVTEALADAQEELEESTEALKGAMGSAASGITRSAGKFFDALTSGESGFKKYGSAVGAAGDAALDVGKQFGVLGTVIGALIKGVSMVVEKQLKFVDSSLAATASMNKLSGGAGPSTEALQKLTWQTGRTMEQFDKIAKPMQSAGKALSSLGGSASEGAKNFMDMSAVNIQVQNQFRRLGVSYDELTQYQADYLVLQRASGRVMSQEEITSGKVKAASLEYVKNLQIMKDLTGEEVTELQARQKEAASTMQMAVISNLQKQKEISLSKQLEAAKLSGDVKQQKAIQDQIDLLDKQKGSMDAANNAMASIGRTDLAGPLQAFLEGGTVSSELATQFGNLGIDLEKYRKDYLAGQLDSEKMQDEIMTKSGERNAALGRSILAAGDNAAQFAKSVGVNKQVLEQDTLQKTKGISRDEEQAKKRAELDAKALAQDDKYIEAGNKTIEAEQKAAVNTEKALADSIDPVLKAMPELATQAAKLTEYFGLMVDALKFIVGATGIYGMAKGAKAVAGAFTKAKNYLGNLGKPGSAAPPTPPAPPTAPPGTPVGKDGKPLRGAALKSAQDKAAKEAAAKAAEAAAKEAAEKTAAKTAAKTATTVASKGAGVASKAVGALGSAAKVAGKFAKFIPGVGLVAAAGSAAMDAYAGAKDAEATLGLKKGEKATTGQKVAAGAAGALSGLTFGLISKEAIGGALNKGLGLGEKPEDKAKELQKQKEAQKAKEAEKTKEELKPSIDKLGTFSNALGTANNALKSFIKTLGEGKSGKLASGSPFDISRIRSKSPTDLAKSMGIDTSLLEKGTAGKTPKDLAKSMGIDPSAFKLPDIPLDNAKTTYTVNGKPATKQQYKAAQKEMDDMMKGFSMPPSMGGNAGGMGAMPKFDDVFGGFAGGSPNVAASQPSGGGGFAGGSPNVAASQPSGGGSFSNIGAGITQDPDVDATAETKEPLKQVTTKPKNVTVGPSADLSGVDQAFLTKFFSAASEYGKPISINSAYRGDQKQAELWVRGRLLGDPGVHTPAKPKNNTTINYKGQEYNVPGSGKGSKHREGDALDISTNHAAFDPILAKYGMHRPFLQKDPPHVEVKAAKGGLASGPKSGYPAELHGNEIIVPLDPNSILAELGKKSAAQAANDIKEKMPNTITDSRNDNMKDLLNINQMLMEMLGSKLDTMINKLDKSNDTQSKILKYSQA